MERRKRGVIMRREIIGEKAKLYKKTDKICINYHFNTTFSKRYVLLAK